MPVAKTTVGIASQEHNRITAQTSHQDGLTIKNVASDGEEKSIIEGFAATTHVDQTNDQFTEEALENMAEQIRNSGEATTQVVFPEIDGMDESEIGNINHNNNPAAEKLIGAGDTRTVSVFKVVHAETRSMTDGETGLHIRGEMLPLPDNVEEAVKGQIKAGALHSFSIEMEPTNVEFALENGEAVRRIHEADAHGTALTGRPMNEDAYMTDAELKNMMAKADEMEGLDTDQLKQELKQEVKQEIGECIEKEMEAGKDAEQAQAICLSKEEEGELNNNVTDSDDSSETEETSEEVKNNVRGKSMTEEKDEPEQTEEEVENVEETEDTGDGVEEVDDADGEDELKNDVEELKNMFSDLKTRNEELQEENEELKSKLDDLKTLQNIKNDISEMKDQLKNSEADLEGERPLADQDTEREVKNEGGAKPVWKRTVDQAGYTADDLKAEYGNSGTTLADQLSEDYDVDPEEVIDYAEK